MKLMKSFKLFTKLKFNNMWGYEKPGTALAVSGF